MRPGPETTVSQLDVTTLDCYPFCICSNKNSPFNGFWRHRIVNEHRRRDACFLVTTAISLILQYSKSIQQVRTSILYESHLRQSRETGVELYTTLWFRRRHLTLSHFALSCHNSVHFGSKLLKLILDLRQIISVYHQVPCLIFYVFVDNWNSELPLCPTSQACFQGYCYTWSVHTRMLGPIFRVRLDASD